MAAQTCTQYHSCTFPLPVDVFSDPDAEDLTITVAETAPTPGVVDAASTPFRFNGTDFFSVAPNHFATAAAYTYELTATDQNGATITTTYTLTVNANAAPVNGALAN